MWVHGSHHAAQKCTTFELKCQRFSSDIAGAVDGLPSADQCV